MKIIFLCAIEYKKINYFFNFKEVQERCRASEMKQYVDTVTFFANLLMAKNHFIYRGIIPKKNHTIYMVIYHLVKYSDNINIRF